MLEHPPMGTLDFVVIFVSVLSVSVKLTGDQRYKITSTKG